MRQSGVVRYPLQNQIDPPGESSRLHGRPVIWGREQITADGCKTAAAKQQNVPKGKQI